MGRCQKQPINSVLIKVYDILKSGPMKKNDLVRALGYKGNSPDAVLTRFETAGLMLWEDGGRVGRMEVEE